MFFLLWRLYNELILHAARRKMIEEHGCKRAVRYRHKDPVFGLDLMLAELSSFKEHRLLEYFEQRYHEYKAYTLEILLFGKKGKRCARRFVSGQVP